MTTTSYVGTQERYQQHLLDELFKYLNKSQTKKKLYSKLPRQEKKKQCCFVSKATNQRCTELTHFEFCPEHASQCAFVLEQYQKACKKSNPSEANDSYMDAKKIVNLVFHSVDNAMDFLRKFPSSDHHQFLHQHPGIERHVKNSINKLKPSKKQLLLDIVKLRYDQWYDCYFGRGMYRWQCETCVQDKGHVAAYYIFKTAILIGKFLKTVTKIS